MQNHLRTLYIKIVCFLLITLSAYGVLNAQEKIKKLTLQEAIDSALSNNKDIQLAMLDEKIASSK